ncbi:glycosyltransferase [Acinetobacter variabilis]|uniref:glycosyltransferase n=1 Tax=Acinetobacter variabilis TaxID=70346 RepID=UPI0026715C13|nr:glycosyltransferase [Acinetobacter variabilis]WKT73380.1 glycosyltransferase [Acinetobacter variabilis]
MKILIFQKKVPSYRVDFFNSLFFYSNQNVLVYSPCEKLGSLTNTSLDNKDWLKKKGKNISLLKSLNLEWQTDLYDIKINKNDIVVIPGNPRDLGYFYLFIKLKLKGVKVIIWTQYWSHTSSKFGFYIRRFLFNFFSGIIFYTEKEALQYLNDEKGKVKIPVIGLNNGLNFDLISSKSIVYNAFNRGDNVVFIGRLTKKSNLDQLIISLSMCDLIKPTLHIIGDGDELSNYRELIKLYNVNAIFYGSLTDEDDISSIMNKCSLFVYPGAVGLSLIHAMSYGVPAIIHDDFQSHGPESAALVNGITGIVFKKDSIESLAHTISQVLKNKKNLNNLSNESIKLIKENFNIKSMARQFLTLIDRVGN